MTATGDDDSLLPLAGSDIAWRGFDAAWYRLAADLPEADEAALLRHYLDTGRHAGLGPNPYFDEAWYRATNPDVAAAIAGGEVESGYAHYGLTGYLTRAAHWLYDEAVYRLHAPDLTDQVLVAYGCANAYDHYLKAGAAEQRMAHLLFQPAVYCAALAPDEAPLRHPFAHFLHGMWSGAAERPTSVYFDPDWYRARHAGAVAAGQWRGALHHFLTSADAGDPLSGFSAAHYRAGLPSETAPQGAAALYDHFLKYGVHRLASPAPGIDLAAHLAANPAAREAIESQAVRDLFAHFLHHGPVAARDAGVGARDPVAAYGIGGVAGVGRVECDIDWCTFCPPGSAQIGSAQIGGVQIGGVLIGGWLLAPPGAVAGLRLIGAETSVALRPAHFIAMPRPDVIETFRSAGFDDPQCGFIAFAEADVAAGEALFVEIERADGSTLMRAVPPPALRGMAAIRALLEGFDLRYDALAVAMNHVVMPAISRLGAALTASALPREVIAFGAAPAAPALSLIIPLHGRLDFMEVQFALLSRGSEARCYDIIYVLDDPPQRRAAEMLAASCLARFGIGFRLVVLGRNAGYAAANNAGLAIARGRHVALVNSDVFPIAPDDFDRLAARLDADPGLGAVGPLLLFEDGAVQHQGMAFERVAEYADMHFPLHPRKGLLPPADAGLHDAPAITGACMVLRREELARMGGLDPAFLVGDFEDADLCLRLAAAGRRVAVDHGVRMYHLERQSQAGAEQRWRMNLTLCNAWTHEQRWGATLRARAAG